MKVFDYIVKHVLKALEEKCITIDTINLSDNKIGNEGIMSFADLCPKLDSLKILNVSGNKIGDKGAARLF